MPYYLNQTTRQLAYLPYEITAPAGWEIYNGQGYDYIVGADTVVVPDPAPQEEDSVTISNTCNCEVHKLMRYENSAIRNAVVHNYSYRPRGGWSLRSVKNDTFPYYLGVELETDNYSKGSTGKKLSMLSNRQAADLRRPKNLWVAKADASVTGPEFASHPATMTFWNKHRPQVKEMFESLLHAGFRSHDNDKCGMHVNISRSAFDDARHFNRFLTLLHNNVGWTLKMSQRSAASASHWASLEVYKDKSKRNADARRLTQKSPSGHHLNHGSSMRYCVINAPTWQPRFEFRLPRGTLRVDRFYKNLQWTVAMIEFTRKLNILHARPAQFAIWVEARKDEYPDLFNFMVEKKLAKRSWKTQGLDTLRATG